MIITKLKQVWWLTIFLVFLSTGCGINNTQAHLTSTPTTLPMTPSFFSVSTSTLVMPTATYTPVPVTPTIPIPTLSAEEMGYISTQLLTQDYRCMLPCWGGIEPGVTTRLNAITFLEQFAEVYSSNESAKINYMGKPVYMGFYTQNNIVQFVGAPRFEYPLYRLLQDYGKPDEVYFYILDVLPIDTNNPYTVYLFYREKGIIAEYYGGASPKGATISVCFRDVQGRKSRSVFLSLWSKGSDKTFQDVIAQYMSKSSPGYLSMKYYKLEELSTNNVNDFYETYKLEENENKCLQIQNPNPEPS